MVQRRRERGGPLLGEQAYYVEPLLNLVGTMVEADDFSSVPIDRVPRDHLSALGDLLDEEIIIRKDLSPSRGDEVLAFPFDELRDFLIARYLVDIELRRDPQVFLDKTRALLTAPHPITEGVSRFLFFAAKRAGTAGLYEMVKNEQWFKDSFLEAIFAVEDDLVDDSDVTEVQRLFLDNVPRVTIALINRYDCSVYKRLNIRLLFALLDELSRDQFDTFIVPLFEPSYRRDAVWSIEDLSKEIADLIDRVAPEEVARLSPLVDLLFYLLPIKGTGYDYPARRALASVFAAQPEVANSILVTKLRGFSRVFSAYQWGLAGDLARGGHAVPKEVFELAIDRWRSLSKADEDTRASLEEYFIAAQARNACAIPEAIQASIAARYRQRARQWRKLL